MERWKHYIAANGIAENKRPFGAKLLSIVRDKLHVNCNIADEPTDEEDDTELTVIASDAISWEKCQDGEIPDGAVLAGKTIENEFLYVGRARLRENRNELTPGMLVPSEKCLLLSYGTGVKRMKTYEVLVSRVAGAVGWVPCKGGYVPPNAVIGGIDCSYLEPLYVGRTSGPLKNGRTWRGQRLEPLFQKNELLKEGECQLPGKIHRSHKCLYIPYMEKEYLFRDYEVLIMKESPNALADLARVAIRKWLRKLVRENFSRDQSFQNVRNTNESVAFYDLISKLPLPTKLKEFCCFSSSRIRFNI